VCCGLPFCFIMRVWLFLWFVPSGAVSAGDWPAWRGPAHNGVSDEVGLPLKWSAQENIAWKVPLPEPGNSTPIVWGDRVFLTQSLDEGRRRELWCFDKTTGNTLWKRGVDFATADTTHKTNPHCSGSPATDGERVIVNFASAGVHCFDFSGELLWSRDLGTQKHIWGPGTSPVLVADRCYVNHGPSEKNAKLVALDKHTGEVMWEKPEPVRDHRGKAGFYGSWSDPLPIHLAGRTQLLMSWPHRVCAVDARTGEELWSQPGLNTLVYTSPLYAEGIAIAMGGFSGVSLALALESEREATPLWRQAKSPQRIASGVIHEGHIYIHNDIGTAQCVELKTGDEVWTERLKGSGKSGQNWSSILLSEGRCYTVNQGGDAFVFRASPKFELLAVNPLGEKVVGSIAASDGQLFIRSHLHLFCVGKR
jgi:outer membrane protein assembly factor BamB